MKSTYVFLLVLCLWVSPNLRAQQQVQPIAIENNDPLLQDVFEEFYDSARYYKVGVIEPIDSLRYVKFIDNDLNFLGGISQDGTTILVNRELKQYPNLLRVIIFRQFGKVYQLETHSNGHAIMGEHWEIDSRHEYIADFLFSRPYLKKEFFVCLAEKAPTKKRL